MRKSRTMAADEPLQNFRIARIAISPEDGGLPSGTHSAEWQAALCALPSVGYFRPRNDNHGPYDVTLSVESHRLVIRTRNALAQELMTHILALRPYHNLIQDYFLMIESHEKARAHASREKLETLDMGRRGLHNEGAELLISRLKDKIEMDLETARRFFTLICALYRAPSFYQL